MISARMVSYILTIIWIVAFLILRKKYYTSKWYFYLLFVMAPAGIVLDLNSEVLLWNVLTRKYDIFNIILFAVLLLLVLIPWMNFDKWLKNKKFIINVKCIGLLKRTFIILIILSLFCIIYCIPYAILANSIGGKNLRTSDVVTLLPVSPLTTIVTGIATLAPIGILFFFIGLLDYRLRKYAIGVLLLPLAGVVHSMTMAARELYIFLPITFIILYVAFRSSLSLKQIKAIKKVMLIFGVFIGFFFSAITFSRFGEFGSESFISGTWGYFYQQPYVFDQTLQFFDNFKGFSKCLSFLGEIIGVYSPKTDVMYITEISFGTMYKAFYEMYGYSSLILGTIIYVAFFSMMSKFSIKRKKVFSILVNFSIFIWFTISGLFYFRYGSIDAQFILYILMMLFSSFYPQFIKVKPLESQL